MVEDEDGETIFSSHEFIKRSCECGETSTKQLLNTSGGHQIRRKTTQCLQREVEQNIQDEKRDKGFRDGPNSGKGVVKEENFPYNRRPSHSGTVGSFGTSESNIT